MIVSDSGVIPILFSQRSAWPAWYVLAQAEQGPQGVTLVETRRLNLLPIDSLM
jgi:hypothetical protein